ncbi:MAG TPA: hypothetical protein VFX16_04290 [Pseudonocardiaceae bacterium]|nr:hypothetical protein [Pseudonocardiaceae bacterium]
MTGDDGRCAVRLVRFGAETSQVGVDVRAALSSWGPADTVLGGIALLGVTPLGCPRPVEAVIVVPRGVMVVVGVDLPDPAVRLEAPLTDMWKADGWPLVREDGAVNPAQEALAAAKAVTTALEARALAPIPVSTIVAVGPYVGQVVQSTGDLHQGVRVLHPDPRSMLTATRELAVAARPCSVEQVRALLAELVGDQVPMLIGEVAAEGFADAVTPDLASASTTLIPRITERTHPRRPRTPGRLVRWWDSPARRRRTRRIRARARRVRMLGKAGQERLANRARWLPVAVLGVLAALVVAGVAVLVSSTGGGAPVARAAGQPPPAPAPPQVRVSGVAFSPKGSAEATDCASLAYGDIQVWLAQHACVDVVRSVYQTATDNRAAAVALAVVTFADPATATAFGTEANTPGSGGITDLVTDGAGWPGGPTSFDNAAYTVTVRDTSVRVTEVVWSDGPSSPTDPALNRLAATSAGLPVSQ